MMLLHHQHLKGGSKQVTDARVLGPANRQRQGGVELRCELWMTLDMGFSVHWTICRVMW